MLVRHKLYGQCIGGQQFNILRQSVCLIESQITVNNGFHFNCITMEQTSVSETFVSRLAPYASFQQEPPCLNLRYSLVITLCEPFSLLYYAREFCAQRFGYNLDIMRQSACLVLNPITVYSYGFLFNCTTVGQASDSMTALT